MEKYQESIKKAINKLNIADHIIYVTYPVIKDKRILLKSLDSIYESLILTINSVLQYDYLNKRIKLYSDPKKNLKVFIEKCAKRYNLTNEEIKGILNFLKIVETHKKSPVEFRRKEKIVIMSDNLTTTSITLQELKDYLIFFKRMITKITQILLKTE